MATSASGTTANFGLSQWAAGDGVKREDFNSDNAAIDAALSAGAKIATGTYVGTGLYGSSNPCSLTFNFKPKVVFITPASGYGYNLLMIRPMTYRFSNMSGVMTNQNYTNHITWGNAGVSWYNDGSNSTTKEFQENETGSTYYYIVIG